MNSEIENDANPKGRVIGFDSHPDSFTAALLRGPTPAAAITEKVFNKIPIQQLPGWAQKHTTAEDLFVLEASGNSFEVVRTLGAIGRNAKAYLAGTAKEVWVPDPKTQEWRDWFHAHRKAVKRTTQMRNRILSYLSDQGVRFQPGINLAEGEAGAEQIRAARKWSARQAQVLDIMLLELRHAEEQRQHWRSLIAQEVLSDPLLLSIVRLCGVRDQVSFALGAIIGDIKRFTNARKLVKYIGLNPAFDDSGEGEWSGGIGGHGRKDLRGLLIESAQSILRSSHPLAKWGKKLLARKGSIKLAVAAIARKLVVAIWYLMMGRWTPLEEIDDRLAGKLSKIITNVGPEGLKKLGKTRRSFRDEIHQLIKTGRAY